MSPQDSIPTILDRGGQVSIEELNPFSGVPLGASGRGRGGVSPTAPEGGGKVSIDELNAFGGIPTEPPPGMAPITKGGGPPADSAAVTLEQVPAIGGGAPVGAGWGAGPGLFDPSLPPTQEDTNNPTLPPRYPPTAR